MRVPARPRLTIAGRRSKQRGSGAVAQLVERIVRNDEARGSIPLGSTIYSRKNLISLKKSGRGKNYPPENPSSRMRLDATNSDRSRQSRPSFLPSSRAAPRQIRGCRPRPRCPQPPLGGLSIRQASPAGRGLRPAPTPSPLQKREKGKEGRDMPAEATGRSLGLASLRSRRGRGAAPPGPPRARQGGVPPTHRPAQRAALRVASGPGPDRNPQTCPG